MDLGSIILIAFVLPNGGYDIEEYHVKYFRTKRILQTLISNYIWGFFMRLTTVYVEPWDISNK